MDTRGKEVIVDRGRNDRNRKLASSSASNVNKPELFKCDAQLLSNFEQSGEYFKYNASVSSVKGSIYMSNDEMNFYLLKIQRGGLIQSFGCMITIEKSTLKVIAYSENCCEVLGLEDIVDQQSGSLLGVDAETLFTASFVAHLVKVARTFDASMINPIYVHFKSKSFYALLQPIDVGVLIDLEPAPIAHPNEVWSETVQAQKMARSAISKLQSVPVGNISILCDMLVQEIQNFLDYDRVMIYKFHDEDDHGEVVSEVKKSHLESYSGLHYPAADIPQAARHLFKQNQVRMICDCAAPSVGIIQSETLSKPVLLVSSTLRAAHACHKQYMENMGSIASLVLAIVVNQDIPSKLWGLAVCHHSSPKYVCFPVRQAIQFLTQAFSIKLQTELNLAAQKAEKRVLQMQTVLCEMLLRHDLFSIITQSPNMMDLVRCDGAAMVYGGKCCLLGVTPTESQVMDIVKWLVNTHEDSSGLSTDSLVEAGYPGALLLGDAVCGMASARIASPEPDFLFWFRSHAAKEIRWGGAVPLPGDRDDIETMHPRSSFTTFLQVIENKSMAWDTAEVDAVHSLQLIMRNSCLDKTPMDAQQLESESHRVAELRTAADNMIRLIENATAPIFGVDRKSGSINGWNTKMVELTGLQASEAFGKSLIDDVIHEDSRGACERLLLCKAMQGEELQNVEIKLQNFRTQASNAAVYLVVNTCASMDYKNDIVGTRFVGQDLTPEKVVLDNFIRLQGDYKAIVHSPNPLIPPIFACDEDAHCTEWSTAMEKLTGCMRHEVIGKVLPREIFGDLCKLKDQDSLTMLMITLHKAIGGHDMENLPFGFFNRKGKFVEVFISANKRVNEHGARIGCLCFLQSAAADEQPSSLSQQQEAGSSIVRNKEVAYLCQELKNPLNGLRYANKILQEKTASYDQKQILEASGHCGRQLMSLLEDINMGGPVEGSKRALQCEEFSFGSVITAAVSQIMLLLTERNLRLGADILQQTKTLVLFGDGIKLQMVLSDLLNCITNHTPSGGWVEIKASPGFKLIHGRHEYIHLQMSLAHSGGGLPSGLIEEMCGGTNNCTGEQGMTLNICYNRVITLMNGRMCYIREHDKCYFLVDLELQTPNRLRGLITRDQ